VFSERFERILGPIAIVIAVLSVIGVAGLVILHKNAPKRDLAAVRSRLDPGDRARVAGTVGDVILLSDGVTAFTLTDASTRDDPLLILTRDPSSAHVDGQRVAVKGTLERFEPAVLGARLGIDFSEPRLSRYDGKEIVVADSLGAKSLRNGRAAS
jgi:hypothetical protein